MAELSSSFDTMWQQYERGDIRPIIDFLDKNKRGRGIAEFAKWVESKIHAEQNQSPIEPIILKRLAEALAPIDREASNKILSVFKRVRIAPLQHEQALEETSTARMAGKMQKIDYAELWNGYKNKRKSSDTIKNIFGKDSSSVAKFVDWAHENIVNDDDIAALQALIQELKSSGADDELTSLLDNLFDYNSSLLKFPVEERADLSRHAWVLCKDPKYARNRDAILDALSMVPREQKAIVIRGLTSLLQASTPFTSFSNLRAIARIPPMQRADILKQLPLIQEAGDSSQSGRILAASAEVASEQRVEFIEGLTSLIQDIQDVNRRDKRPLTTEQIVTFVEYIAPEQRADVIRGLIPVLKGLESQAKLAILEAVYQAAPGQRAEMIATWTSLLQGIPDGHQKSAILEAVAAVAPGQRADVFRHANPLLQDIGDGYERVKILKAVVAGKNHSE